MVLFNCNCLSLGIALVYKFVNISADFFVGLSVCYNCSRSTVLFFRRISRAHAFWWIQTTIWHSCSESVQEYRPCLGWKESEYCLIYLNPSSPNIHIQILNINLHSFPCKISWENLTNDQSIFPLVILNISSHNLSSWCFMDIVRRKLMLVSLGT